MKKKNYYVLIPVALMLVIVFAPGEFVFSYGREDVGTSGAVFLKIGSGARPSSLGDAYTSVSGDVNSLFHNPAGLSSAKNFEFTAQYGTYFQSILHNALAFSYRLSDKAGVIGVGVINLSVDKIDKRTSDTAIPDTTFSAGDYAYIISYARQLWEKVSLGVNAKYIYSKIDDKTAGAFAGDIGVIAQPTVFTKSISVGIAAQNLGQEIKFDTESDPLPFTIKAGISSRFINEKLLISLDTIAPRDNSISFAVGAEYTQPVASVLNVSARAGYRTSSNEEKLEGLAGLTAGAGIVFKGQYLFDFAWIPYGILGDTFRYSLSVRF